MGLLSAFSVHPENILMKILAVIVAKIASSATLGLINARFAPLALNFSPMVLALV